MRIVTIDPLETVTGDLNADFYVRKMRENIDNMEGVALRREKDGKTLLYMISDDNYNLVLQRTVLLMFEVADGQPIKTPPSP